MPIPVTFSAPAGATYDIVVDVCLRDGVWLLMFADTLHKNYYAYDPAHLDRGVRINVGQPYGTDEGYDLPQMVINVAVDTGSTDLLTTNDAERLVHVVINHFELPEAEMLQPDPATPPKAVENLLARTEELLMRGTLYRPGQTTNAGVVIDPYHSPLEGDGTYVLDAAVKLNNNVPRVRRLRPYPIPRRAPRTKEEKDGIWQPGDIAIIYGVDAAYTIDVPDREKLSQGGYV